MSSAKLIESNSIVYSLVTIFFATALLGCSPREHVVTKPKVASGPSSGTVENSSKPPTPNPPTAEVEPASEAEQKRPKDALALRIEAKQLADELIRRFPNNPDALEIKARFLMLFGETQDAKACWQNAIQIDPNYAYALHGLGKIAMLNSDFEQAIEYLKRSIPRQPSNADPVHDLSDAYLKAGKVDDSIACLRQFADKNSQSALTFLLLGQSYLAKEQFEEAESAFNTVLKISPGQPRAENGLATALIRLGKRDQARELLANQKQSRKANEKNRSPDEVFQDELKELSTRFHTVAEFYAANNELRTAEKIARRALVLNPLNVQPKALLVDILQKQDRLRESLELVEQLANDEKENPRWPCTRGALLCLLGDMKSAKLAYEEAIQIAPPVQLDMNRWRGW